MTDKITAWWSDDGRWFCILANDGVNQATISLTPEEAQSLAALARQAQEPGEDI